MRTAHTIWTICDPGQAPVRETGPTLPIIDARAYFEQACSDLIRWEKGEHMPDFDFNTAGRGRVLAGRTYRMTTDGRIRVRLIEDEPT